VKYILAGKKHIWSFELSFHHILNDGDDDLEDEEFEHIPQDPHGTVYASAERDGEEHGVGSAGAEWGDKMAPLKAHGFGFTRG
jgi:hypothetical protein